MLVVGTRLGNTTKLVKEKSNSSARAVRIFMIAPLRKQQWVRFFKRHCLACDWTCTYGIVADRIGWLLLWQYLSPFVLSDVSTACAHPIVGCICTTSVWVSCARENSPSTEIDVSCAARPDHP